MKIGNLIEPLYQEDSSNKFYCYTFNDLHHDYDYSLTYGKEYSAAQTPQNGRLQILGAANGQFAKIDYQPPMDLRDFYIFPYDMRHVVYPFNGTEETRRTLAANCDVQFDPIKNRGAV